jgi:hypothetical protein
MLIDAVTSSLARGRRGIVIGFLVIKPCSGLENLHLDRTLHVLGIFLRRLIPSDLDLRGLITLLPSCALAGGPGRL